MLIDTHAHISFPEFFNDLEEVLDRAKKAGVEKMISVGCDLKSCEGSLALAQKHDFVYATLGLHPYEARAVDENLMKKWEELARANKKIVAIGECGLDYFKAQVPKDIQKNAFRLQLKLAQKLNLPVIVHNREADEDCLEILKEFYDQGKGLTKIVFHCYGSNLNFAERLWNYGYMISFTGVITYPSASGLREVVEKVPMDLFMVETDCPYLAPQAYRGKRNEPSYVPEVVRCIAKEKKLSYKEIEEVSTDNAKKFFNID
ncbi:MAG: TatD family hydrolase [Candidatus Gracilibacteria bacterium]|jgi:TatD DNase family protein